MSLIEYKENFENRYKCGIDNEQKFSKHLKLLLKDKEHKLFKTKNNFSFHDFKLILNNTTYLIELKSLNSDTWDNILIQFSKLKKWDELQQPNFLYCFYFIDTNTIKFIQVNKSMLNYNKVLIKGSSVVFVSKIHLKNISELLNPITLKTSSCLLYDSD